jgi:hypothetical protein
VEGGKPHIGGSPKVRGTWMAGVAAARHIKYGDT